MAFWFNNRNKRAASYDDAPLVDAVNTLTKQHNLLVTEFEDLKKAHLKLRGQFYAEFGAKEREDVPKPETRDELRARMVRQGRFIPGKPPVHSEK